MGRKDQLPASAHAPLRMTYLFPVSSMAVKPSWWRTELENRRSLARFPSRPIFFPRIDDMRQDSPRSLLSIVSTIVMGESSQWLKKNMVRSDIVRRKTSRKAWIGSLAAAIKLENGDKHHTIDCI